MPSGWLDEDVRLFDGYDESDPRPPGLRALELAQQVASGTTGRVELSLGTQAADRMVGEPTTFPKAWFDGFKEANDATPLLAQARAIKTEQEIERMRLANEIAAGAIEHVSRASVRACGERGRRDVERLGARSRHRLRGQSISRTVSRSSGPARDPHVHRDRQPADPRARADALRDLGLRRRLLVRPHEEPRAGRARAALRRARAAVDVDVHLHHSSLSAGDSLAELDREIRSRLAEIGYPGQPSHPICHGVGARAHEPPYAHQAGGGTIEAGMVLAIEPGVYWPEGGGLRVEDNFLITDGGPERLCRFPDGIVRAP